MVKVLVEELAELIVELPTKDEKKKAEMLRMLHENKIVYRIEGSYLIVEGFGLEMIFEDDDREFFIKYEVKLDRGRIIKWIYAKMDEPNVYYRIRAIHCPSSSGYIKALRRRGIPSSCIRMASEVLRDSEIKA